MYFHPDGGLQQWVNVHKSPVFIKATLLWMGQHPQKEQGDIMAPSHPLKTQQGASRRGLDVEGNILRSDSYKYRGDNKGC